MKDSNYQLISRYLEGEATKLEKQQLQNWRAAKLDHENQFQEVQLLWEKGHLAKALQKEMEIDVSAALSKVKKQFSKPEKVVNRQNRFLRIAAAASVLLAVGALWFFNAKVELLEVATLANEQKRNHLA